MSDDAKPGMLSCVFCERLRLRDYVGHERYVASFEPLNPVTPGHRLFIPHRHVMDAAMAPLVSADVFEVAATYAADHNDDFNLITSGGVLASQTILHFHVHYVPRRESDGLALPWTS